MPFKITTPKKFQKLLDPANKEGLVAQTRKEFSRRGTKKVKQAIVQDMIKGISPVKGGGKWKKYSQSYKDVIQNKAAYFMKNGKIVRVGLSTKLRKGLVSSKSTEAFRRRVNKKRKASDENVQKLITKYNSNFHKESNPTKQISPVNLRHSGKLHKSLKVFTKGGFLSNFRMVTQFKNKLADIHNRLGAGKSKVIRRLLPTRRGERFNNRIEGVIFTELKKAADYVAKQFSGQ